jgi:hypothetical protein
VGHLEVLKDLANVAVASDEQEKVLEATQGLLQVLQRNSTTIQRLKTLNAHLTLKLGLSRNRNWDVVGVISGMKGTFVKLPYSCSYLLRFNPSRIELTFF